MEFKQIRYEKDPETGIVQISLNRPEIKNALGVLLLLDLYVRACLGKTAFCTSGLGTGTGLELSAAKIDRFSAGKRDHVFWRAADS